MNHLIRLFKKLYDFKSYALLLYVIHVHYFNLFTICAIHYFEFIFY